VSGQVKETDWLGCHTHRCEAMEKNSIDTILVTTNDDSATSLIYWLCVLLSGHVETPFSRSLDGSGRTEEVKIVGAM
jgi:hypothetical protein